jgi:hypothetical protein
MEQFVNTVVNYAKDWIKVLLILVIVLVVVLWMEHEAKVKIQLELTELKAKTGGWTPGPPMDTGINKWNVYRDDRFEPYAGYSKDLARFGVLTGMRQSGATLSKAETEEYQILYDKIMQGASDGSYSKAIFDDYNGPGTSSTTCALYAAEQAETATASTPVTTTVTPAATTTAAKSSSEGMTEARLWKVSQGLA